jgi:hypothetical protein
MSDRDCTTARNMAGDMYAVPRSWARVGTDASLALTWLKKTGRRPFLFSKQPNSVDRILIFIQPIQNFFHYRLFRWHVSAVQYNMPLKLLGWPQIAEHYILR